MSLVAASDASVLPDVDTALLVAPATSDVTWLMSTEGHGVSLFASSRHALFIALGVVLGIIFVVVVVLAFTCTLKQCQRLRRTGQFKQRSQVK